MKDMTHESLRNQIEELTKLTIKNGNTIANLRELNVMVTELYNNAMALAEQKTKMVDFILDSVYLDSEQDDWINDVVETDLGHSCSDEVPVKRALLKQILGDVGYTLAYSNEVEIVKEYSED